MKIIEFDKLEPARRPAGEPGGIKIVEFGYDGQPKRSVTKGSVTERRASDIQLYMFQTGTLKTKLKYIKMNQGDGQDFEIPVPWFLIKHPRGNVVIDGGNAVEVATDKRGHWGAVVDAYDPVMDASENCVDQARGVGVRPEDVRYVLQSHLHLDHSGACGRFPNATTIVQRIEHEYAYSPDWFAAGAYIRADFDKMMGQRLDKFREVRRVNTSVPAAPTR